jgi:hypothetical protein
MKINWRLFVQRLICRHEYKRIQTIRLKERDCFSNTTQYLQCTECGKTKRIEYSEKTAK